MVVLVPSCCAPLPHHPKHCVGCLTVGVVTKPFTFEGNRRMRQVLVGFTSCPNMVLAARARRVCYLSGSVLPLVL